MSNRRALTRAAWRTAGDYETVSGHERRQRLRSERIRQWRKEMRRRRASEFDDRFQAAAEVRREND